MGQEVMENTKQNQQASAAPFAGKVNGKSTAPKTEGEAITLEASQGGAKALMLAADLGTRHVQTVLGFNQTALHRTIALFQETLDQYRRSSDQAVESVRTISGVRTFPDLLAVQSELVKGVSATLMEQTARLRKFAEEAREQVMNSYDEARRELAKATPVGNI